MFIPLRAFLTAAAFYATMLFAGRVSDSANTEDYISQRTNIINTEKLISCGGKINLTLEEIEANKIVLRNKQAELQKSHENTSNFLPSLHFFKGKALIDNSTVFSIIKKLPKGGSLHTHMLAAVSVDYVIENITYWDNLYGCFLNSIFKLQFFELPAQDTRCDWKKLSDYRKEDANFDQWLRQQLSLEVDDPLSAYPNIETVWKKFKKTFSSMYDMICYKPAFQNYIYRLLKELYDDNVMYTELRGTFMPLYDLNGTTYDTKTFFETFIGVVEKFKKDYPGFLGVRYIHSIYRGVSPEVLTDGLDELIQLKHEYPDFIAGFDFVGFEEEGKRIVDYHKVLLEAGRELKFFFHAGETNWYGSTDLNLVDAILLNSSRIGHAFGLSKHPLLTDLVKTRNISIEVCPISSQVLMLNQDPRNHPAVSMIANGVPVVIGNDDPSAWGATGVSYDWYVAFMAMTPEDAGLEVLKQFAINSITYSAMAESEKALALEKLSSDWRKFIEDLLE